MKIVRIIAAILLGWLAIAFGYETFTVPAFAATAPAILMLACGILAWFVWPRRSKTAV